MAFDNRVYQREWKRKKFKRKPRYIITIDDRQTIRALKSVGVSVKTLSKVFVLKPETVRGIINRHGVYAPTFDDGACDILVRDEKLKGELEVSKERA
jgi:hypothetical protein